MMRKWLPVIASGLVFALTAVVIVTNYPDAIAQSTSVQSVKNGNWSDATTWSSGSVPSTGSGVTINHVVTLNTAATVVGVVVQSGAELRFAPATSVALTSTGNVIVYGTLTMRPASPPVIHTLRFIGINETNFVGGGMDPLATDVGLWVMGDGKLDIAGTTKTAWAHAVGSIAQGATQVTLQTAPVGWQVGDEISIAPTEPLSVGAASWNGFDLRTITAISGATITLSAPTARAHPVATNPFNGTVYTAEVLNLTRNVRIEGTGNGEAPLAGNGRSHIFIRSTVPQSIAYLAIRHMGPRKPDGQYTLFVTGRYGLHFHHSMDGSRGTLVEGVVIRDTGSHAYVPHASHGITFKDTVSYNTFEDVYWWDSPPCGSCPDEDINDPHDLTYDHALAALVRSDPAFRGYTLAGFELGKGENLVVTNSAAVGVQGNGDSSAFTWPSQGHAVWTFHDNIAHNSKADGIFAWQNDKMPHVIRDFVAFHNGDVGIDHGAYGNAYQYADIDVFDNGQGGFSSHASSIYISRPDGYGQAIERLRSNGLFTVMEHTAPYLVPTLVKDCIISGVSVEDNRKTVASQYDFVNCVKPDGTNIEPSDFAFVAAWPDGIYRVQHADGTAYQTTGAGVVTSIAPFYAAAIPTPTPTMTPTPTATTYTSQPDATAGVDTYVQENTPDTVNGTAVAVVIANAAARRIGLFKFDVSSIPPDSIIVDATLSLWTAASTGVTYTLNNILVANSAWNEASTWSYKTPSTVRWAGDAASNGGADAGCSVSGTDYSASVLGTFTNVNAESADTRYDVALDVAQVTEWLTGNYGFVIRGTAGSTSAGNSFRSSDYAVDATKRPRLVINYTEE